MRSTLALLALVVAAAASPRPQGVTSIVTPTAAPPSGCTGSTSGTFQITVVNVTSSAAKRDLVERQQAGILTLTLNNGILKDQAGRTGYIASNYQFQFDEPPQAGAIYTGGFSLCGNGSLALGGSAVFYQCLSGTFYNLYDRHWAAQCSPIYIVEIEATGGSSGGSSGGGSGGSSGGGSSSAGSPPPSSLSGTAGPTQSATSGASVITPSAITEATSSASVPISLAVSNTTSTSGSSSNSTTSASTSGTHTGTSGTAHATTASTSPSGSGSGSGQSGATAGTSATPSSSSAPSAGGATPKTVFIPQTLVILVAVLIGAVSIA